MKGFKILNAPSSNRQPAVFLSLSCHFEDQILLNGEHPLSVAPARRLVHFKQQNNLPTEIVEPSSVANQLIGKFEHEPKYSNRKEYQDTHLLCKEVCRNRIERIRTQLVISLHSLSDIVYM